MGTREEPDSMSKMLVMQENNKHSGGIITTFFKKLHIWLFSDVVVLWLMNLKCPPGFLYIAALQAFQGQFQRSIPTD